MTKNLKKPHFVFFTILFSLFMGCVTSERVSNEDTQWKRNKPAILTDSQNLMSEDFKIPKSLKNRVSFWLDIYGRYDSRVRVIHDSQYPWIIYEVVD
ncbi:MAG: hypothetical protein HRT44_13735, partial [Bdellovibrionales bacterium]|nr:hypothetical protein [Bdellovibrionales bacterium]NQZ20299.1 hypothetical protein [Bdellovibrionales bacterium]